MATMHSYINKMNSSKKQIGYLCVLRVLACICIVILHCFKYSCSLADDKVFLISDSQMNISLIIQYVMNWAVPCFVMITGALLLDPDKDMTYKKIFCRYILKMLIVIVIFSIIFEIIDTFSANENITLSTVADGVKNSVLNKSWIHMWYLYMVVAIYLMLPIFRLISKNSNKKDMLYLLVLFGIFLIAADIVFNGIFKSILIFNQNENLNDLSNLQFYIFINKVWPFYLFLGYAINKKYIKIKPVISIFFIILGIVFISFFVLSEKYTSNEIVKSICYVLYSFNSSPGFLFIALGAFSFAASMHRLKRGRLFKVIKQIDACSFGIYLIHIIPIKIIMVKYRFNPYEFGGVFGVIWFSLGIMAISFAVIWLLKRIPIFKKL